MKKLQIYSEIEKLKKVMIHHPGEEIENLTPKWLNHLLFDDIPWLALARKEHDAFASIYRDNGIEVLYLVDLIAETLDQSPIIKEQFIKEANVTSETLSQALLKYLLSFTSTKEMIEKTMAGIRKSEMPHFKKRTLADHIRDYPFITDPMPNLYFTRDPFSIIGDGVAISKMFTSIRSRETIYGDYIFRYHPFYGGQSLPHYYQRDNPSTIEGGDILVLNEETIAIGISERTHPSGIEKLAQNLFINQTNFKKILAFDLPKTRSFMHLDTIFSQVDYNKFTIHAELMESLKIYEIKPLTNNPSKLKIIPLEKKLKTILSNLLDTKVALIPCGGKDIIASAREQWSDGANTMAIAPGKVIVYERNHRTNDILDQYGISLYPIAASELSRGRGGPRCMSMPFIREKGRGK